MKIDYTFKHCEKNEEVVEYLMSHFDKMEKFEYTPLRLKVVFIAEHHQYLVEAHISGQELNFKAHAEGKTFYSAIDQVVDKISKQLSRKKDRVQYHKKPELSHEGKMARLNPELTYEPMPGKPLKKAN